MSKRATQLLGVGVLVLGILAALPFRRQGEQLAAQPTSGPELQLQQTEAPAETTPIAEKSPSTPTVPTATKLTPIAQSSTSGAATSSSLKTTKPLPAAGEIDVPQLKSASTGEDSTAASVASTRQPMVPTRPPPPPRPDELPRKHFLVDGDSLPDLAERYLGSRNRYGEILEANPGLIPELLPLRSHITIPPRFPKVKRHKIRRTKLVPVN